jgi:ELWxxDGT repeat protein
MIRHVYCPGQHGIDVVNDFVLVREVCGTPHRWSASALETDFGPLPGVFPATGGHIDSLQMPLYVRVGQRIAYAASGPGLHNRELWVSDRNFDGQSMTMVDIWPGRGSSNPHGFVSHGSYFTFLANDGQGAALWRTDGTVKGTHKANS